MTRVVSTSGRLASHEIRDLVQSAFIAELVNPSTRAWLVSAWIIDSPVLDNRGGGMSGIVPSWPEREILLSEVIAELLSAGTRVRVVTNDHPSNSAFPRALYALAAAHDSESQLSISLKDGLSMQAEPGLHRKRFVTDHLMLWGSMNFTRSGLERNAEDVALEVDRAVVAQAVNEMEQLYGSDST